MTLTEPSSVPAPHRRRAAVKVLDLCDLSGLVSPDPAAPKLTVADPAGHPGTAETELSVPDADLLAERHATNVSRRRGP